MATRERSRTPARERIAQAFTVVILRKRHTQAVAERA